MFLMELPNHQEHRAFCVKLSGGGDVWYVNYYIIFGRMFIIFLVFNQLDIVSLCCILLA